MWTKQSKYKRCILIYNICVNLIVGKLKTSKTNYAVPGEPLTQQEMEQMIRQAENGNFNSLESVKEKIAKWKEKFAK
jgi:hypothetical protein